VSVIAASTVVSKGYWYLTRSTGAVSLLLLTVSVVFGIVQVTRFQSPRLPRFLTVGLHRNVSLLVVAFLAVHVVTAVLDSFAPIRWLDAIVPFGGSYRPLWLGFGALALDLLIALVVTSLARRRLGLAAWRLVHWLAYACWPFALLHALGTGSDDRTRWSLALDVVCVVAVVVATLARLVTTDWVPRARRAPAFGAVAAFVIAVGAFALTGPLQRGWAARAGTPVALLRSTPVANLTPSSRQATATTAAPAAPVRATVARLHLPFSASLAGTIVEHGPDANGQVVIVIDGHLHDGASGRVHLALAGEPLAGGGVSMEQSRVYLGPRSAPAEFAGTISALDGTHLEASLRDARGRTATLAIDLRIDDDQRRVTGSAQASRSDGG
jgi:sulfoxide reductase heme-binding subunit YedZ